MAVCLKKVNQINIKDEINHGMLVRSKIKVDSRLDRDIVNSTVDGLLAEDLAAEIDQIKIEEPRGG